MSNTPDISPTESLPNPSSNLLVDDVHHLGQHAIPVADHEDIWDSLSGSHHTALPGRQLMGDQTSLSSDSDDNEDERDVYQGGAKLKDLSGHEDAQFPGLKREKIWQIWRPRHAPPPPKASLEDADVLPLATASLLSKLTYTWITPVISLGYQRWIQAERETDLLSTRFLERLKIRQDEAAQWNLKLDGQSPRARQRILWRWTALTSRSLGDGFSAYGKDDTCTHRRETLENEWRRRSGFRQGSIVWSLNDIMTGFWAGGLFKVAADMSQLMSPLLVKALINFSKEVYSANQNGTEQPNIGRGVGMAIGLFCLTVMQSICQHQFFFRSYAFGLLARATLISSIYKRALFLSIGARTQHPNGKLMNHLSSDISRIDYCAQWFHAIWTAPIQLLVTLILLLLQIGPSALVGFSLFILLGPLQTWFMRLSMIYRKRTNKWTDARSKLLQELLASMQIIKVFTYEIPFLSRLSFIRRKEMLGVRKILIIRAANQAIAFSVPTLAAVLSFVTYASTHPNLDPALIFTSLAYFNLLRQPLMFLPRALSSLTDAQSAIERLTEVFEAEVIKDEQVIDPRLDVAVRVEKATFVWASVQAPDQTTTFNSKEKSKAAVTPRLSEETQVEPFSVQNLSLVIPRGRLVAFVGPVGSGKSSILQGLIGEMTKESGKVEFGGRLGYCQQNAWIQNTTLRENILFGRPWDENRYWQAVKDSSLLTDLEILPDGDLTEIGEKGVNLSGGQKQRVNIARALYYNADIILFDDPLSAVDAHVGKALFNDAIVGLRSQGKTVLLVTHALHFLPMVDYIYTIQNGHIVEDGAYDDLMRNRGPFSKLVDDFGGTAASKEEDAVPEEEEAIEKMPAKESSKRERLTRRRVGKAAGTGKLEGRLMVSEVRKTGTVGRKVYAGYLKAGQAKYTFPSTLVFASIMQGAQVMSTVWLTYWQDNQFDRPMDFYEGVYAVLGVAQATFTFLMGASMGIMSFWASNNLHSGALQHVFYSPMSVFDTQPLGRMMGVLGKDIDTVDNQLADALRMMALTLISLIGSVIIITVYFNYFIAIIFVVGIGYWYFALYYRTSARELKRLDSMLRSLLYSHFSESLSGLATIRAYGETGRFIKENAYYMDLEDRAYFLTITNQRWLSVRLDFLGACLVFAVAIMSAKGGGGLTASQIALCLTYLTSITQIFGMVTRQMAEVENSMNAVERVLHYADAQLPQEPAHVITETEPPASWPASGAISLQKVVMSYRKGLPPVLKNISADIKSGEKVGIVGRTGAGKSSITVALYRLAELTSGSISIDGVDINKIGLNTLRSRIAIIPQNPVLFSGTLRSNLDPFKLFDDARLYDALKRACLLGDSAVSKGQGEEVHVQRLNLDSPIEDEGLNLSVGERSLVSLARALVKDSKIVLLDEATAAVDLETDAKIQETIRREFEGRTILCIAHRLLTVISWDRILVMSAGEIEEFDTPLALFDKGGHFRDMCDKSHITRDTIVRVRAEERKQV